MHGLFQPPQVLSVQQSCTQSEDRQTDGREGAAFSSDAARPLPPVLIRPHLFAHQTSSKGRQPDLKDALTCALLPSSACGTCAACHRHRSLFVAKSLFAAFSLSAWAVSVVRRQTAGTQDVKAPTRLPLRQTRTQARILQTSSGLLSLPLGWRWFVGVQGHWSDCPMIEVIHEGCPG